MGSSIVWFVGVALIIGIVVTNPKGTSAAVNSLSSGVTGTINALEVSKG